MRVLSISFIIILLFWSCSSSRVSVSKTDAANDLVNKWVHSFEEDYDGIKVYRPSSYDFPPARGRVKIDLQDDGKLVYFPISPTDKPAGYEGSWSADKTKLTLRYGQEIIIKEVVSVDASILKIK